MVWCDVCVWWQGGVAEWSGVQFSVQWSTVASPAAGNASVIIDIIDLDIAIDVDVWKYCDMYFIPGVAN